MTKNLDFSILIPQRDTFTDADGSKHEFKARVDFGAVDLARTRRLQKEIEAAMEAIAAQPEDETAATELEAQAAAFVKLILPSLPAERIIAMTLGQKTRVVEWWMKAQQDDTSGEASANQPPMGDPKSKN